jgi:choline dehydrogenase-like flavoprotein
VHTERHLDETWTAVAARAESEGRSIVPMPYAYRGGSTVTMSGTAFNAFVRLVQPEERAGRIKVVYDAHALRLEWSPSSHRVDAVVYRDTKTGKEERLPCRAVVVAAGAINTAQLLLNSKSPEFPDGLGNRHGVLGRYLHDHPVGKLLVDLATPVSMSPPAYVTRPVVSKSPPLYAAACMQWSGAAMYVRSVLRRHPGRLAWAGFSVFGTMAPAPENAVSLDPDGGQNEDGSPCIAISIRHPKESFDVLNATRDDLLELFARAGFSPTVRVWHIESPGSSNHYGGTCRMHASPEYGMVDGWGRLHAVPNVAVGDSAVFTTGPEKNPVVTSMALSARASDRLAKDLQSGAL